MTPLRSSMARLKICTAQRRIREHTIAIKRLYREIAELQTFVREEERGVNAEMAAQEPRKETA